MLAEVNVGCRSARSRNPIGCCSCVEQLLLLQLNDSSSGMVDHQGYAATTSRSKEHSFLDRELALHSRTRGTALSDRCLDKSQHAEP